MLYAGQFTDSGSFALPSEFFLRYFQFDYFPSFSLHIFERIRYIGGLVKAGRQIALVSTDVMFKYADGDLMHLHDFKGIRQSKPEHFLPIPVPPFRIVYNNPSKSEYPVIPVKIPHDKMPDYTRIIKSRHRIKIISFDAIAVLMKILMIHDIF